MKAKSYSRESPRGFACVSFREVLDFSRDDVGISHPQMDVSPVQERGRRSRRNREKGER